MAVLRSDGLPILRSLLAAGAAVNNQNSLHGGPLFAAAVNGRQSDKMFYNETVIFHVDTVILR